jgi:NHLM bacteriocin system ABC transporter ATP-binding protein
MTNLAVGPNPPSPHALLEELLEADFPRLPLDGRRPYALDDCSRALRVIGGHVDLFAVPIAEGQVSARRHLCRVEKDEIILGLPVTAVDDEARRIRVLAVGGQGAEAFVLDRRLIKDPEALETWVVHVSSALLGTAAAWGAREAKMGASFDLAAGEQVRAPAQGVAWILVDRGEVRLGDFVCRPGDPPIPLASGTWIESNGGDAAIRVLQGVPALGADLWSAIDQFHAVAMHCVLGRITTTHDEEVRRFDQRADSAAKESGRLFKELANVVVPSRGVGPQVEAADPLFAACRIAAKAIGADVVRPRPGHARSLEQESGKAIDIARASGLRSRRVLLRAKWWQRYSGSLVAWHGGTKNAVAIIPVASGGCVMVDPQTGAAHRINAKVASELAPDAVMLYARLPAQAGSVLKLIAFCMQHGYADGARIALSALALGMLALATPLTIELLIDSVIPRAELDQLLFCAAALCMVAIGVAGFQAIESIGTLRLEGLLNGILQAGVIDRLLRLPASFFRQYTAGDLADRALGIDSIRQLVTSRTLRGMLASVFLLFSFALMFYYNGVLALIAVGLTAVRAMMIILVDARRLKYERQNFEIGGRVHGLLLQLLTGVGKLRVASATQRGLGVWARAFARQKRNFVASQRAANLLNAFEAAFPILATLVIFAGIKHGSGAKLALDTGQFLAFYAAFGQAAAAVGEIAVAIGESLVAIPRIDRLRPLLTEPMELAEPRNVPGKLSGSIELSQVTFRYVTPGPLVVNKVTIEVKAGEYVAIVGPSGSGKSTIFRLLLGFERPESGTIFFDGKAIDTLDIAAIRRQIGIVLQNGKLTSGSLYENICGGAQLSLEQAWKAARLAGLDADIEAMPMGMHTVIAEGVSTLSGGQRQRLMIARALVHRPRILLLDEATSALDNPTQAIVSASLAGLNITRLVIAQRLSTVRGADRIIVLVSGEVAQSGTVEELSTARGMFADFARRQMI